MKQHICSAYNNQISVKTAYRYAYDAFVYRGGTDDFLK